MDRIEKMFKNADFAAESGLKSNLYETLFHQEMKKSKVTPFQLNLEDLDQVAGGRRILLEDDPASKKDTHR